MIFDHCGCCADGCQDVHNDPCGGCAEHWCQATVFRLWGTWQCEDVLGHVGQHYAEAVGPWPDLTLVGAGGRL